MSGAVERDAAAPAIEPAAPAAPRAPAPRPLRVPRTLELAAAVSWRLLVVGAAVIATFVLLARLQVVFVSAAAAILVSCALWPTVLRLRSLGARPGAAALVTLLALVSLVAATVALVVPYAVQDVRELDVDLSERVDSLESWLVEGPLALSEGQAQEVVVRTEAQFRAIGNRVTRGAWDGAKLAVELVAGILLTVVLTFFFLKDGDRMWRWARGFVPAHRRDAWNRIGLDVRDVLAGFLRGTTIVAAVDAVGIGLGLLVLGVPLVVPIALLTFVGGFVPLVGATIAGAVAVVIAFLTEGLLTALAVLALVLLVQQLEGSLLQPLVVGRSVRLHPAVILLVVGAGAVLWGIGGALLAVPITAAVSTILAHVRATTAAPEPVVVDES